MASKAANLEKQVECPICLEQFKEPKVLSCLHSYCKSCLQKYVTKTSDKQHKITCPECRQETQVLPNHQVVGCLQWHYWHNTKIMICISPIFIIFLLFLASLVSLFAFHSIPLTSSLFYSSSFPSYSLIWIWLSPVLSSPCLVPFAVAFFLSFSIFFWSSRSPPLLPQPFRV